MTEHEVAHWKANLDLWYKAKQQEMEELSLFRKYGARQAKDQMMWVPATPTPVGYCVGLRCRNLGEKKVGDAWLCDGCYEKRPTLSASGILRCGAQAITSPRAWEWRQYGQQHSSVMDQVAQQLAEAGKTVSSWCVDCNNARDRCTCLKTPMQPADYLLDDGTRPMKCPLCGTNPGRCDKALDSTEKKCFSCGRELEAL